MMAEGLDMILQAIWEPLDFVLNVGKGLMIRFGQQCIK